MQKAAILLIALGPERSAGIFKHLKEEEIEELTLEIANTRSVTPQVKEEVINEFYEVCLAQQYIAEGGINYAKELLEKALGSDKAMDVIGKLTASLQVKPFEFVRKTDASQLINFIQDEHPQTIALILSYLSPSQDLDGDGIVEIPTQPDEAGLLNMSQSRRMDFIVWMDYTSPNPEKSFGLLDEETNCYIELPMEWEGNLKLTDSEQYDGAVELRTVDEDELVMTLRLVRTTSSLKGWTRLGIVASRQMQAKLAPDVEISDKNYRLSKALHLLN